MELEVGWSRKGIFIKIVQNALTWESPQAFKRYWSIAFILVQLKFTSLRVQASPPPRVCTRIDARQMLFRLHGFVP